MSKVFICKECGSKWRWVMRSYNGLCILCLTDRIRRYNLAKKRIRRSIYEYTDYRIRDGRLINSEQSLTDELYKEAEFNRPKLQAIEGSVLRFIQSKRVK